MKTLLLLFLAICVTSNGGDTIKRNNPPQSKIIPVNNFSPLNSHYRKITYADSLISKENFLFEEIQSEIKNRPIILMCLDESNYVWHAVHISIPYPTPISFYRDLRCSRTIEERENVRIPIKVISNSYVVKHVYGANAAKLNVDVFFKLNDSLIPLTVFRIKYPNIIGGKIYKNILQKSEAYHYTPLSTKFSNNDFEAEGFDFLKSHVDTALKELKDKRVFSRSYKDTLLSDLFKREMIMSLMVSEQWDPLYFINDTVSSYKKILSEYGLNREESFMWSISSANAIGCLQFTNARNNGTYSLVVREYKEVGLNDNFRDGSRDMNNVIKAAICLLDYELSQSSLAKTLFLKDEIFGSIYAVSAYNGGPIAALDMIQAIERRNGKDFNLIPIQRLKIPYVISQNRYKNGNTETPMYIKKYLYLINQFSINKK